VIFWVPLEKFKNSKKIKKILRHTNASNAAKSGKYITENVTSLAIVGANPLYKPNIPFSFMRFKANFVADVLLVELASEKKFILIFKNFWNEGDIVDIF